MDTKLVRGELVNWSRDIERWWVGTVQKEEELVGRMVPAIIC